MFEVNINSLFPFFNLHRLRQNLKFIFIHNTNYLSNYFTPFPLLYTYIIIIIIIPRYHHHSMYNDDNKRKWVTTRHTSKRNEAKVSHIKCIACAIIFCICQRLLAMRRRRDDRQMYNCAFTRTIARNESGSRTHTKSNTLLNKQAFLRNNKHCFVYDINTVARTPTHW